MNRTLVQLDLRHLATRFLHRLLNRDGHFTGLALTHANGTLAVADDSQRSEAENTAALHHFSDAVDGNHLLAHTVIALVVGLLLLFALRFCHVRLALLPA